MAFNHLAAPLHTALLGSNEHMLNHFEASYRCFGGGQKGIVFDVSRFCRFMVAIGAIKPAALCQASCKVAARVADRRRQAREEVVGGEAGDEGDAADRIEDAVNEMAGARQLDNSVPSALTKPNKVPPTTNKRQNDQHNNNSFQNNQISTAEKAASASSSPQPPNASSSAVFSSEEAELEALLLSNSQHIAVLPRDVEKCFFLTTNSPFLSSSQEFVLCCALLGRKVLGMDQQDLVFSLGLQLRGGGGGSTLLASKRSESIASSSTSPLTSASPKSPATAKAEQKGGADGAIGTEDLISQCVSGLQELSDLVRFWFRKVVKAHAEPSALAISPSFLADTEIARVLWSFSESLEIMFSHHCVQLIALVKRAASERKGQQTAQRLMEGVGGGGGAVQMTASLANASFRASVGPTSQTGARIVSFGEGVNSSSTAAFPQRGSARRSDVFPSLSSSPSSLGFPPLRLSNPPAPSSHVMTRDGFAAFCTAFMIVPQHISEATAMSLFDHCTALGVERRLQVREQFGNDSYVRSFLLAAVAELIPPAEKDNMLPPAGAAGRGRSVVVEGEEEGNTDLTSSSSQTAGRNALSPLQVSLAGITESILNATLDAEQFMELIVHVAWAAAAADKSARYLTPQAKVQQLFSTVMAASFITVFDSPLPCADAGEIVPECAVVKCVPSVIEMACASGGMPSAVEGASPRPSLLTQGPVAAADAKGSAADADVFTCRLFGEDFGALGRGMWLYDSISNTIRHLPTHTVDQHEAVFRFDLRECASIDWHQCRVSLSRRAVQLSAIQQERADAFLNAPMGVEMRAGGGGAKRGSEGDALSAASKSDGQQQQRGDHPLLSFTSISDDANGIDSPMGADDNTSRSALGIDLVGVGEGYSRSSFCATPHGDRATSGTPKSRPPTVLPVPNTFQITFQHNVVLMASKSFADLPFTRPISDILTVRRRNETMTLSPDVCLRIEEVFRDGCSLVAFNHKGRLYHHCWEYVCKKYRLFEAVGTHQVKALCGAAAPQPLGGGNGMDGLAPSMSWGASGGRKGGNGGGSSTQSNANIAASFSRKQTLAPSAAGGITKTQSIKSAHHHASQQQIRLGAPLLLAAADNKGGRGEEDFQQKALTSLFMLLSKRGGAEAGGKLSIGREAFTEAIVRLALTRDEVGANESINTTISEILDNEAVVIMGRLGGGPPSPGSVYSSSPRGGGAGQKSIFGGGETYAGTSRSFSMASSRAFGGLKGGGGGMVGPSSASSVGGGGGGVVSSFSRNAALRVASTEAHAITSLKHQNTLLKEKLQKMEGAIVTMAASRRDMIEALYQIRAMVSYTFVGNHYSDDDLEKLALDPSQLLASAVGSSRVEKVVRAAMRQAELQKKGILPPTPRASMSPPSSAGAMLMLTGKDDGPAAMEKSGFERSGRSPSVSAPSPSNLSENPFSFSPVPVTASFDTVISLPPHLNANLQLQGVYKKHLLSLCTRVINHVATSSEIKLLGKACEEKEMAVEEVVGGKANAGEDADLSLEGVSEEERLLLKQMRRRPTAVDVFLDSAKNDAKGGDGVSSFCVDVLKIRRDVEGLLIENEKAMRQRMATVVNNAANGAQGGGGGAFSTRGAMKRISVTLSQATPPPFSASAQQDLTETALSSSPKSDADDDQHEQSTLSSSSPPPTDPTVMAATILRLKRQMVQEKEKSGAEIKSLNQTIQQRNLQNADQRKEYNKLHAQFAALKDRLDRLESERLQLHESLTHIKKEHRRESGNRLTLSPSPQAGAAAATLTVSAEPSLSRRPSFSEQNAKQRAVAVEESSRRLSSVISESEKLASDKAAAEATVFTMRETLAIMQREVEAANGRNATQQQEIELLLAQRRATEAKVAQVKGLTESLVSVIGKGSSSAAKSHGKASSSATKDGSAAIKDGKATSTSGAKSTLTDESTSTVPHGAPLRAVEGPKGVVSSGKGKSSAATSGAGGGKQTATGSSDTTTTVANLAHRLREALDGLSSTLSSNANLKVVSSRPTSAVTQQQPLFTTSTLTVSPPPQLQQGGAANFEFASGEFLGGAPVMKKSVSFATTTLSGAALNINPSPSSPNTAEHEASFGPLVALGSDPLPSALKKRSTIAPSSATLPLFFSSPNNAFAFSSLTSPSALSMQTSPLVAALEGSAVPPAIGVNADENNSNRNNDAVAVSEAATDQNDIADKPPQQQPTSGNGGVISPSASEAAVKAASSSPNTPLPPPALPPSLPSTLPPQCPKCEASKGQLLSTVSCLRQLRADYEALRVFVGRQLQWEVLIDALIASVAAASSSSLLLPPSSAEAVAEETAASDGGAPHKGSVSGFGLSMPLTVEETAAQPDPRSMRSKLIEGGKEKKRLSHVPFASSASMLSLSTSAPSAPSLSANPTTPMPMPPRKTHLSITAIDFASILPSLMRSKTATQHNHEEGATDKDFIAGGEDEPPAKKGDTFLTDLEPTAASSASPTRTTAQRGGSSPASSPSSALAALSLLLNPAKANASPASALDTYLNALRPSQAPMKGQPTPTPPIAFDQKKSKKGNDSANHSNLVITNAKPLANRNASLRPVRTASAVAGGGDGVQPEDASLSQNIATSKNAAVNDMNAVAYLYGISSFDSGVTRGHVADVAAAAGVNKPESAAVSAGEASRAAGGEEGSSKNARRAATRSGHPRGLSANDKHRYNITGQTEPQHRSQNQFVLEGTNSSPFFGHHNTTAFDPQTNADDQKVVFGNGGSGSSKEERRLAIEAAMREGVWRMSHQLFKQPTLGVSSPAGGGPNNSPTRLQTASTEVIDSMLARRKSAASPPMPTEGAKPFSSATAATANVSLHPPPLVDYRVCLIDPSTGASVEMTRDDYARLLAKALLETAPALGSPFTQSPSSSVPTKFSFLQGEVPNKQPSVAADSSSTGAGSVATPTLFSPTASTAAMAKAEREARRLLAYDAEEEEIQRKIAAKKQQRQKEIPLPDIQSGVGLPAVYDANTGAVGGGGGAVRAHHPLPSHHHQHQAPPNPQTPVPQASRLGDAYKAYYRSSSPPLLSPASPSSSSPSAALGAGSESQKATAPNRGGDSAHRLPRRPQSVPITAAVGGGGGGAEVAPPRTPLFYTPRKPSSSHAVK